MMAPILLLALLGLVQPYKLSLKHPDGHVDNQPAPLPPPPQPASQVQQFEKLEQQTLLHPYNDYANQQVQQTTYQEELETAGVKGVSAAAKPERELARRPNQQIYLPNPQPQALAYVIVRPIQYPQNSGYGGPMYPEYGYNSHNQYGGSQYNNQYRPPYYGRPPYNPYGVEQPLLDSNLRDEEQRLEGEYLHSKGGVRQEQPQPQPDQPAPAEQPPLDLYAEKKGKLQKLMDKIHSMIPFGSTYQINDDVPPPTQPQLQLASQPSPQPQVKEPIYRPSAPIQQQSLSQVKEPIPDQLQQQTLSQQQIHDDREVIREPEQLHQEQLKEEKDHSKTYKDQAGDLKREKDHLNSQQLNLAQDADSGFASSKKRVSTN